MWQLLSTEKLLIHIGVSLRCAALSFSVAILIALPLDFLLGGWFKRVQKYLNPLLTLLAKINPFSVFLIFILLY